MLPSSSDDGDFAPPAAPAEDEAGGGGESGPLAANSGNISSPAVALHVNADGRGVPVSSYPREGQWTWNMDVHPYDRVQWSTTMLHAWRPTHALSSQMSCTTRCDGVIVCQNAADCARPCPHRQRPTSAAIDRHATHFTGSVCPNQCNGLLQYIYCGAQLHWQREGRQHSLTIVHHNEHVRHAEPPAYGVTAYEKFQ